MIVWFTGIPCSGKTTLARAFLSRLKLSGELLDGDELRKSICRGLGFSREDRDENVRRVGFVARLLARHGVWAVVSLVSPYREARRQERECAKAEGIPFCEVYVKCPVEVAVRRDVKGMYKKAQAGEIQAFTGVSDVYEEPESPDMTVDTGLLDKTQCLDSIFLALSLE